MEARLDLRLSQKLVMTIQLQQAIKLLQLSRLELSQLITQELTENPLLEESATESSEDESIEKAAGEDSKEVKADENGSFELKWDEYFDSDSEDRGPSYYPMTQDELPNYEQIMAKPTTLTDHLLWQLKLSPSKKIDEETGAAIIGNLDDDGYLRASTEEVAAMTKVGVEDVERVLKIIQTFDPMGVGARDLKECLLLQVEQLGLKGSLMESIIAEHLPDMEKRKYSYMAKTLGVSVDEVYKATKIIEGLEPKPGRSFTQQEPHYIIPDVFVVKSGEDYQVVLNEDSIPRLRISPLYRQLLKDRKGAADHQIKTYIEEKFKSALWLVRSIEQRNRTIYRVVESIVTFQREFLEKGIAHIKPMVLKDVASDINMHESTISRVTTNKYVHTPRGLFELKYFFSTGIQRRGGADVSSISIRESIRKIINEENGTTPLSDYRIAEILKERGTEIARRTVAKYRKELKIPSANRRRNHF